MSASLESSAETSYRPMAYRPYASRPLDENLYAPDEDEKTFFKTTTGIEDNEELKRHIISVQQRAWNTYPYPCIRVFEFMRLKLARLPAYPDLLKLGRERSSAIFVDLGCCFGNDVRKAVLDGYPVQDCVAVDLRQGLWNHGHELFRSTPQTFPVPFLQGNVFDDAFLPEKPVLPTGSPPPTLRPEPLGSITTLDALRGHASAIYMGAFFHLFREEDQKRLAHRLAGLLSPEPGSMLLGVHGAMAERGFWRPAPGHEMFCHSPESWRELWEGVFGDTKIEVRAILRPEGGGLDFYGMYPGNQVQYQVMEWSITRM